MIGDLVRVTVTSLSPRRVGIRIETNLPMDNTVGEVFLVTHRAHEIRVNGRTLAHVMLRNTSRGQAKLGFKAPRNVPVHREEVYDKIAMEADLESVMTTPPDAVATEWDSSRYCKD
jgi:carbon storage regulator CsrA